jgi:hypothetical protein
MATAPKTLEVEQDLRYQKWEWRLQRVGWVLIALFVLAAALGFVAEGPLTKKKAAAQDGSLQVEYGAVLHYHNPSELRLFVAKDAAPGNELHIQVSVDYLDDIQIKTITPEPLRVEAGSDSHTFIFAQTRPGAATALVFHIEPNRIGRIAGQVQVAGKEAVTLSHFVWP